MMDDTNNGKVKLMCNRLICPECGSFDLFYIGSGTYKCSDCNKYFDESEVNE